VHWRLPPDKKEISCCIQKGKAWGALADLRKTAILTSIGEGGNATWASPISRRGEKRMRHDVLTGHGKRRERAAT